MSKELKSAQFVMIFVLHAKSPLRWVIQANYMLGRFYPSKLQHAVEFPLRMPCLFTWHSNIFLMVFCCTYFVHGSLRLSLRYNDTVATKDRVTTISASVFDYSSAVSSPRQSLSTGIWFCCQLLCASCFETLPGVLFLWFCLYAALQSTFMPTHFHSF